MALTKGMPIVISDNIYGVPVTIVDNGRGVPVTLAEEHEFGLPVKVVEKGGLPVQYEDPE